MSYVLKLINSFKKVPELKQKDTMLEIIKLSSQVYQDLKLLYQDNSWFLIDADSNTVMIEISNEQMKDGLYPAWINERVHQNARVLVNKLKNYVAWVDTEDRYMYYDFIKHQVTYGEEAKQNYDLLLMPTQDQTVH